MKPFQNFPFGAMLPIVAALWAGIACGHQEKPQPQKKPATPPAQPAGDAAKPPDMRLDMVSKGGFAAFLETRTIVSSDGWVLRVSKGRPDDPKSGRWDKWNVDPSLVRDMAKELVDGGFLTQETVKPPKDVVIVDAPSEVWALKYGDKTAKVEIVAGGQVTDTFPKYMRDARDKVGKWTAGKPAAGGTGAPPPELKVE